MFLAENRLIFFWKQIRSVCCFSMTALFADNVNFPLFFVCRTILCGEFIACFTYFNCNVDITGLGRNGSFFKIFCGHTAASWIVITNPFNSKFSRFFADFCFYNVSWFFKICSLFLFCFETSFWCGLETLVVYSVMLGEHYSFYSLQHAVLRADLR